jgi:hypothetical protein
MRFLLVNFDLQAGVPAKESGNGCATRALRGNVDVCALTRPGPSLRSRFRVVDHRIYFDAHGSVH